MPNLREVYFKRHIHDACFALLSPKLQCFSAMGQFASEFAGFLAVVVTASASLEKLLLRLQPLSKEARGLIGRLRALRFLHTETEVFITKDFASSFQPAETLRALHIGTISATSFFNENRSFQFLSLTILRIFRPKFIALITQLLEYDLFPNLKSLYFEGPNVTNINHYTAWISLFSALGRKASNLEDLEISSLIAWSYVIDLDTGLDIAQLLDAGLPGELRILMIGCPIFKPFSAGSLQKLTSLAHLEHLSIR